MSPQKIQDIIIQRPGSKIPRRVFAEKKPASPHIETAAAKNAGGGAPPRFPRIDSHDEPSRKPRRILLWSASAFSLLVLVFAFSTFFEKATLKIVPKQKIASFDSIVVARKGADQTARNLLPFEMMEFSDSVSRDMVATSLEKVSRRASGKIIIYNNYSAESQRLIKNTRFETSDGKIYRIRESVIVPGQKTISDAPVPGSVEAVVYADEPGVEYNKGPSDFTIPGFKGTPRFSKFYARSVTEISGGFSGEQKTIGADELKKVVVELQEEVKNKLLARAYAEKPSGFSLFDDGVFVVFGESVAPAPKEGVGDTVTVSQSATLYGALFNEDSLGGFITEKLSYNTEGSPVRVENFSELEFKIIDKANFNPEDDAQFSFTLKGKPKLVWSFDAAKLREKLRAVSKSNLAAVLTEFPSITRAEVTFRPFWKRSFPDSAEDIIIESLSEE